VLGFPRSHAPTRKCSLDTQVSTRKFIVVGAGRSADACHRSRRRGIRCILLEQKAAPQFLPKMERCNARTMESTGAWGLQKIRDAGFPAMCRWTVHRHHAHRAAAADLPYPSWRRRRPNCVRNDGTLPLEPYNSKQIRSKKYVKMT